MLLEFSVEFSYDSLSSRFWCKQQRFKCRQPVRLKVYKLMEIKLAILITNIIAFPRPWRHQKLDNMKVIKEVDIQQDDPARKPSTVSVRRNV